MTTREDIRARIKARADEVEKPHPITVPVLGTVYVRLMSALTAAETVERIPDKYAERIIFGAAMALCDEAGERVYDATNKDDLAELGRVDLAVLTQVVAAANKLNGMSEEGAKEAGND